MLYFDLRPLFKLRGIEKPYTALVKAGISPQSATKILNDFTYVFRLNHVETICRILNCTPNDLLNWKPDKDSNLPESHALYKLCKSPGNYSLQDSLKNMTIEELNQIATIISEKKKNK